jgi:hypothetical protein
VLVSFLQLELLLKAAQTSDEALRVYNSMQTFVQQQEAAAARRKHIETAASWANFEINLQVCVCATRPGTFSNVHTRVLRPKPLPAPLFLSVRFYVRCPSQSFRRPHRRHRRPVGHLLLRSPRPGLPSFGPLHCSLMWPSTLSSLFSLSALSLRGYRWWLQRRLVEHASGRRSPSPAKVTTGPLVPRAVGGRQSDGAARVLLTSH